MLLECSWCSVQPGTLGQMQNYNCMVRRTSRRDYTTVWITVQLLTVCPRPAVLDKLLAIELLFTLWCKQAPRSATDHAVIILHLASCCGSGLRTPSTLIAFVRTPNINILNACHGRREGQSRVFCGYCDGRERLLTILWILFDKACPRIYFFELLRLRVQGKKCVF